MKRLIRISAFVAAFVLSASALQAQVPIEKPDFAFSYIGPKYFGPYAFPVPDLNDGRISRDWAVELSGDAVIGTLATSSSKDYTYAPTFKVEVPLGSRVALTVWGEFHEWYKDTYATRALRRVDSSLPLSGHDGGNVYFSLDILLCREGRLLPSLALRAATLTATGDEYEVARHYDAPGYFFDLSAGKNLHLGSGVLRPGASMGFVCWQIDRGTQNDAFMLGAKCSYDHKLGTAYVEYGQYTGREGIADAPKSFKAGIRYNASPMFKPFVYFQKGLNDWPFTQFRAGLRVEL